MSEYHDSNYSMRNLDKEEFVPDIANILSDEKVLFEVRSNIDYFIISEIMEISPILDRWYIENFIPINNFKSHAFEGEYDECLKDWNTIITHIENMNNPEVKRGLEKWRKMQED